MRFHILTLFPDMVEQGLNTSIIGRAVEKGILSIEAVNIRDYTLDRHKKVDDYPYGGGAGMVMQAQPIYDAWQAIVTKIGYRPRTVYLTPQGPTFHQGMAKEYAKEEDLILLCGHYEGIDERVLEEIVTDYVSIGDYVLNCRKAILPAPFCHATLPVSNTADIRGDFRETTPSLPTDRCLTHPALVSPPHRQ